MLENKEILSFIENYDESNDIDKRTMELLIDGVDEIEFMVNKAIEKGKNKDVLVKLLERLNRAEPKSTGEFKEIEDDIAVEDYDKEHIGDNSVFTNKDSIRTNDKMLDGDKLLDFNYKRLNEDGAKRVKLTQNALGIKHDFLGPKNDIELKCFIGIIDKVAYPEFEDEENDRTKRVKISNDIFYNNLYVPTRLNNEVFVKPIYLYHRLQCNVCGLRYEEYEHLEIHLNDHRRKEAAYNKYYTQYRSRQKVSMKKRVNYFNVKESNLRLLNLPRVEKGKFVAKSNSICCNSCGKVIGTNFDNEIGEWVYKGIEYNNECYHRECIYR